MATDGLARVFAPGGIATELGFSGFEGRKAVDIGSGDGSYSDLPLKLGALSMTCIEQNMSEVASMHRKGNCVGATVLAADATTASRLPDMSGAFDIATLFNIAPHQSLPLLAAGVRMLHARGELIVTTAEVGLLSRVTEIEKILDHTFARVETAKLFNGGRPKPANNFLTVATQRNG